MSEQVTKKDFAKLDEKLDRRFDETLALMETFMHQVDSRFNKLEERMDSFDEKLNKLTSTIDGFIKRLDEVDGEQTARDAQFERLLKWARKVSEKTGIPLENL